MLLKAHGVCAVLAPARVHTPHRATIRDVLPDSDRSALDFMEYLYHVLTAVSDTPPQPCIPRLSELDGPVLGNAPGLVSLNPRRCPPPLTREEKPHKHRGVVVTAFYGEDNPA